MGEGKREFASKTVETLLCTISDNVAVCGLSLHRHKQFVIADSQYRSIKRKI